jgi:hypothetical protein
MRAQRAMICGALLGLAAFPAGAADLDLKPANTYVVIAGVLQWPAGGPSGFPTKHRKDEELYDVLRARGVPAENMKLVLDEQATYSGVKRAVREVAAKAPGDATLVVYYCGHGFPIGGGEVCLANYDLVPQFARRTGLLVSDLAGMVKDGFHGKRVLFLADCCFSGGLAKAAEGLGKAGFEAAYLTSSDETMTSTVNWTFTQTVIDALNGETFADANGDGVVTLGELAAEVSGAMGALERQRAGFATHGLGDGFKLAVTGKRASSAAGKYKVGEYVLTADGRRERAGRVVGAADGKLSVQFYDYTEKRRVERAEAEVSALPKGWETGKGAGRKTDEKAEIEVEWQGQWFPATVLKKNGERTQVHYVGYGDEWDEWVAKDRIRPLK